MPQDDSLDFLIETRRQIPNYGQVYICTVCRNELNSWDEEFVRLDEVEKLIAEAKERQGHAEAIIDAVFDGMEALQNRLTEAQQKEAT